MAYISIPSIWRAIPEKYRLIGFKCKECEYINFPRRRICLNCGGSSEFEQVKLSGRGTVYAFTNIERGATVAEHAEESVVAGTLSVAIIELEEGIRVMGQITDCDPSEITVGMAVEAVFRKIYFQDIVRYGYKFRPLEIGSKEKIERLRK